MADVVRYSFYLPNPKGKGTYLIEIFQREVGKTFRYMKISKEAITEDQAKGICKIINDGGNIKNPCNYVVDSLNYNFEWKVGESLVRAESKVYDKIQTYVKNTKGLSAAAPTAAAQAAPVAAPQQQSPKTIILPITGTIIKKNIKDPTQFYFELPFYDQTAYDELVNDIVLGTGGLFAIDTSRNIGNKIINISFRKIDNTTQAQLKEDYETLDRLIKDYLEAHLAQITASAKATQQQSAKTIILPITGTIIKNFDIDPKKFYFELPFYDQDKYDELLNDFERGTDLIHWASNVYVGGTADTEAIFTFKEPESITQTDLEQDYKMLDQLIKVYLIYNTRQKSTPVATQPAATQTNVANLDSVNLGEPYYLLPKTEIQIYKKDDFNIPEYSFYLTGQNDKLNMVIIPFISSIVGVTNGSAHSLRIKVAPDLYRITFQLIWDTLSIQETPFLSIDDKLIELGYVKNITTASAPKPNAPKPDSLIDIEAQVDKLKTELDQLVFLRTLNSELDFEKNIEIGQKIAKVKENINELNFSKLQAKISTDDIFDQLFEQSFTPIQHVYSNLKVTQGQEGDFFTPNGKPSELSEQLNELIRTQQFKDWFGDWQLTYMYKQAGDTDTDCSVVLTENFEPKLFYHGTGQEFSYFKFDKFPAAYFAANQAYSQWFANLHGGDEGYTIPFFLNVRNPLDLTQFGTEEIRPKDFFDYMYLQTGFDAEQLEVNPLFLNPSAPARECWVYLRNNPKMLKKLADNQVYDGIHFYETNPGVDKGLPAYKTEVYITFKAEQSKIADNDRGLILMASLKSFLLEKGGKI
jgi:hypothetical protein